MARQKVLGALPVVASFCRNLDIAGIVDRACPVRDVALLTHGQVIEALIANRLTSPTPLVHVEDWARSWAVPEMFGIEPWLLNDDRIGRALDAIAPEVDAIVGSVGARAIARYGIEVSRLHWDMTSFSLFGEYSTPELGFVQPRYGHPKDRRPDLRQVQAGLAVAADGGVPVFWRAYDGGAGEIAQVTETMEALQALAGPRKFLVVGDSKLVSYQNLAAIMRAGTTFIAPASKLYVGSDVLAACDFDAATPVVFVAERDAAKPAAQRAAYRVLEDTMAFPAPKSSKAQALMLRRLFVWSSANAGAAASTRTAKLARATDDLERLGRGLGGRHYPTVDAVNDRLAVIGTKRRVTTYLVTTVGTDPTGKPTLDWHFDQHALAAEAATDGWYALLTNLDADDADAAEVLRRYKGQEVVERRYSNFKGPLAVAPMFLKNNRRIEALINVICMALLIFCLIERALRQAIAPDTKMTSLGRYRDAKPTGRLIFEALDRLRLIPAKGGDPPIIPTPAHLETRILELLDVDPTQPR